MPSRAFTVGAAGKGSAVIDGTSHAAINSHVADALTHARARYGQEPTAWLTSVLTSHLRAAFSARMPLGEGGAIASAALDAAAAREVLRITVNLGIGMLEAIEPEDLDALIGPRNLTVKAAAHSRPLTAPFRIYTLSPQVGATHLVESPSLSRDAVLARAQRAFPAASVGTLESLAPMMFTGGLRGDGVEVISWGSGAAYSPRPQALIARVHARMNFAFEHRPMTAFASAMEAA
jgi:hypothetical protein